MTLRKNHHLIWTPPALCLHHVHCVPKSVSISWYDCFFDQPSVLRFKNYTVSSNAFTAGKQKNVVYLPLSLSVLWLLGVDNNILTWYRGNSSVSNMSCCCVCRLLTSSVCSHLQMDCDVTFSLLLGFLGHLKSSPSVLYSSLSIKSSTQYLSLLRSTYPPK